MPIDPIRFNLATTVGAPQKAAQAADPAGGDAARMAADQLQLAVRKAVQEGLEPEQSYRVPPPKGEDKPRKKFKLGLGANLDDATRIELNASLNRGGTVKIELHQKF